MDYGLLGEKLAHSFSPQIHKALGGYDYGLLPTAPEDVASLFTRRDFQGLNVTIPYKQTVIPLCDEVDPRALAIGAVNTVVNRDGRLTGYNTDIDGLIYLSRRAGIDMAGKKVVILGSGGTSRTARTAAKELGAADTVVISRRGEDNYGNLSRHADAEILINTTPVGMYPRCGASPVSLDAFPHLTGVLDVVYNPLRTALYMDAEARGIPASCGLPMLTAQAARAVELFTGRSVSNEQIESVLRELTAQLQNIVLIGMPGCGKSAVGRCLAKQTGRELIDLDREIACRAGCSIPQFFAAQGEDAFRALESEVVRDLGSRTGVILATGGGVVTRRENYPPLHQNGVIVHLTRPLDLLPVKGRPVSQKTPPEILWQQREPLYRAFADLTVHNTGSLEDAASEILRKLSAFTGKEAEA